MRGYGGEFFRGERGRGGWDEGYAADYWRSRPRGGYSGRAPRRRYHGYPVRGYRVYDLDYGSIGGPTTDYSGRAGYPEYTGLPDRDTGLPPRGHYTPRLEDEDRGRTLYGGVSPGYRGAAGERPRRRRPGKVR